MCGRFSSALKPSDAWLEYMQESPDGLFNRYSVHAVAVRLTRNNKPITARPSLSEPARALQKAI